LNRLKLYIGRYDATRKDWWKKTNWQEARSFLGGEPAAARLTDYIKPETITVYGPEEINKKNLELGIVCG
jgi:hypothetical protein